MARLRILLPSFTGFRTFWVAQSLAEIGGRLTREVLPLIAVLVLGTSTAGMVGLRLAESLPVFLAAFLTSVVIDRLPRSKFLVGLNIVRGVVIAMVPILFWTNHLKQGELWAVVALLGITTLAYQSAVESYLPSFLDGDNLALANQWLNGSISVAEMVGPALAGLLVQVFPATNALWVEVALLAGAVLIWRNGINTPSERTVEESSESLFQHLRAGIDVLRGSERLRALLIVTIAISFGFGLVGSFYALYCIKTFHMPPALYGVTVMMGGIGALVGSALSGRIARRVGMGTTIVIGLGGQVLATACIPLAQGPLFVSFLFIFAAQLFGDMFGVMYDIYALTLRQTGTPDAVLGRVSTVFNLLEQSARMLALVSAGIMSFWLPLRDILWIAMVPFAISVMVAAKPRIRGASAASDASSMQR
ncbi:MFS transporter [Alicyclobacillus dauci]|uniref:MFS transporter n=1 Tax=Alicyclobacillus dauci TaxID=1475485 RepID=A0ABY6Z5H7_9BACL|nr:MFS transporter [Alicyclobacillus dauci]WAH37882.1 MFS transporter [Alicyclobacillus dauci]